MKFILIIFLTLLTFGVVRSELLFKPLTANQYEPRVGAIYQFVDEKLRLDIGTSIDLITTKANDTLGFSFGGDFFTYTRLRSENNFKFPVETSDYYFGVNSAFKGRIFDVEASARLRLAHISSHMVDGLATGEVFNEIPFVYSREFIDFTATAKYGGIRYYAGFIWAFSTKPANIKIFTPHFGFDNDKPIPIDFLKDITGLDFNLVFGVDLQFINAGRGAYETTSSQIGLLLKTSQSAGIIISYYNYYGKSVHGMFYDMTDRYQGIGFQLYFY